MPVEKKKFSHFKIIDSKLKYAPMDCNCKGFRPNYVSVFRTVDNKYVYRWRDSSGSYYYKISVPNNLKEYVTNKPYNVTITQTKPLGHK